jgi:YgiT-type zinc finger domain-containing protein
MKCRVCGGALERRATDLPFKIGNSSIVILKDLPVLQCGQCDEIDVENSVMSKVEEVLSAVDHSVELEIVRYAA